MRRRKLSRDNLDEIRIASIVARQKARNRTKSKVRAKVEHCFGVMKQVFGFTKMRYRGLDKNAHRLFMTCTLVNLFIVRRRLIHA